jgi:hypothetical protein
MSQIGEYRFHEAADILPLLDGGEYEAFKSDVKSKGVREPLVYWMHPSEGKVYIDGRNRARAALDIRKEDAEFPLPNEREFKGSEQEILDHVLSLNLQGRRHLSSGQKAAVAAMAGRLFNLYNKREKVKQLQDKDLAAYLANLIGTNRSYIYRSIRLRKNAPGLLMRIIRGELNIPRAEAEYAEAERKKRQERGEADPNVIDGTGEPADPRFLNEMATRDQFEEVCRIIRQARGAVNTLANGDHGGDYLAVVNDEVTAFLTNAETAVKACMPHAACPACEGEGRVATSGSKRKSRCGCCGGKGWVTEALYNSESQAAAEIDTPDEDAAPEETPEESAEPVAALTDSD